MAAGHIRWDTSVILGTLKPGNYTIYVESSPLDRLRIYERGFCNGGG